MKEIELTECSTEISDSDIEIQIQKDIKNE